MMMESDHSNEEIDILSGGQENAFGASAETYEDMSSLTSDSIRIDTASNGYEQHKEPLNLQGEGRLMESPKPGPSGINQISGNEDFLVDSDDSVEIIDIPRKPVPLIVISDSSSDSEIDVIEVNNKPKKSKPKKNEPKTIKERLEEQKDSIFAVKMEAENKEESPPNKYDATCSICLGTYQNRAFLDDCFHSFCYTCILQWAKVVHTCPLCKTAFKSLIYDITPDLQYKQDFMDKSSSSATQATSTITFDSWMDAGQRFRYRTTLTSVGNYVSDWYRQRRFESFRSTSSSLPHHRREPRRYWGRRHPSAWSHSNVGEERRKSVYRNGLIIREVRNPPGRVKYRNISVQFFKENPAVSHRLVPWILRDLKVLLSYNSSDASFILHLIMSLLQRYPMESDEFYNQLQPYLFDNTRQFIRELISFASSPYDMQTYDSRVVHDFPSTIQSIATTSASQPNSVLQSQTATNSEWDVSFRDRLLDEMFQESGDGPSPPLHSSHPQFRPSSPTYHPSSPTYNPSNQQEDRGTLEDQRWSSSDSVIDVTGTSNVSRADVHFDSLSSEFILRCLKGDSSRNGSDCGHSGSRLSVRRKSVRDPSPVGGGNARHMAKDNDMKTKRKPSSRSRSPASRSSLSLVCSEEDLNLRWGTRQNAFMSSMQDPSSLQSRNAPQLHSRSEYREKYSRSRRSKSRDSNERTGFLRSSYRRQKESYKSTRSNPKSYPDISRSRSKERRKDYSLRRSRSRSKDSVLSNLEPRSHEFPKKKEDVRMSRSLSRESSNLSDLPRHRSKKAKKKLRSEVTMSKSSESNDRANLLGSISRENKREFSRSSRSRESSYHSKSSESRSVKNMGKHRSRSSRSPRSRICRSRSKDTEMRDSKSKKSWGNIDSERSTSRSRESSHSSKSRSRKAEKKRKSRTSRSRSRDSNRVLYSKVETVDASSINSCSGSSNKKSRRRVYYKGNPKSRENSNSDTDRHRSRKERRSYSKERAFTALSEETLNGRDNARKDIEIHESNRADEQTKIYKIVESPSKDGVPVSNSSNLQQVLSRPRTEEGGIDENGSKSGEQGESVGRIEDRKDVEDRDRNENENKIVAVNETRDENILRSARTVREKSPEYNPVKNLPQSKRRIVKIKRRPFGMKTSDESHEKIAVTERRDCTENGEEGGNSNKCLDLFSEKKRIEDESETVKYIGEDEYSTSVTKSLENKVDVVNEHGYISVQQSPYNTVSDDLFAVAEENRNYDAIPALSGDKDIYMSKDTCIESNLSGVDNGAISLYTTDTDKMRLSPAGVDVNTVLGTLSTNRDLTGTSDEVSSAATFDENYLSTIARIPSLDDSEIEASIKELDNKISLSKETLDTLNNSCV